MDTAVKLHDVGVTLFYHIITLYNDDSAFYPPSKQLLTTCIETLGQVSTVKSYFSVPTSVKSQTQAQYKQCIIFLHFVMNFSLVSGLPS
jgi:hypothetical protein